MDDYQKEISLIQKILKDNPKGMTVTDISRKIRINRNSVAKYLDIMKISGLVEMITFGPAKVFFPSRRVPVSDMINYTSDYIIVSDKDHKIVLINKTFLEFIKVKREKIIGQTLNEIFMQTFKDNINLSSNVDDAFDGLHFEKDISFNYKGEEIYFKIRIIPTTFEDGNHGAALIIKNVTDQKIAEKALRDNEKHLKALIGKIDKR